MSRDKQTEIHEIAKRMSEAISTEMEHRYISDERKLEAALKENGWCKASDLAEEIFAEMHQSIKAEKFHHKNFGDLVYLADIDRIFAELKKKYTVTDSKGDTE